MTDYIEVSRPGLDRISGKATNCFKQNFKSIENALLRLNIRYITYYFSYVKTLNMFCDKSIVCRGVLLLL